jgi:hypothetical protein
MGTVHAMYCAGRPRLLAPRHQATKTKAQELRDTKTDQGTETPRATERSRGGRGTLVSLCLGLPWCLWAPGLWSLMSDEEGEGQVMALMGEGEGDSGSGDGEGDGRHRW